MTRLHFIRWTILLLATSFVAQTAAAQAVWRFRLIVAVTKQTADYYEQEYGKPIAQIVGEQLATINTQFNNTTRFKARYEFRVDSMYVFTGPPRDEVFRPHPAYHYAIVIDGFPDNSLGGGWLGDQQTIYHSWRWSDWGGPFAGYATDGLTHELAHARGAVDLYAMQVDAAKNPVNGTAFTAVSSVMTYPYNNVVWDEYTANLLNSTADQPIVGDGWVTRPFPATIGVRVTDHTGVALDGATVEAYPVEWFSYSVTGTPINRATTNRQGQFVFPTNPFQPGFTTAPWHIRYPNFLLRVSYNSTVVYTWMPLYDVQNAYFRNGPNSAYLATVVMPASTPLIRISSVSDSSFCLNSPVSVSFTTSGTFLPGNVFSLHLLDEFSNSYELGRVSGTGGTSLTATIPVAGNGQRTYKLRVMSFRPDARSNDVYITIKATPTLSLVGSTTLNVGLTTPLLLSFTGGGPYQYQLTNGLGGTAKGDTVLRVSPRQTTTYRVSEVRNSCGLGKATSLSAVTMTVTVPTLQTLDLETTTLCVGNTLATSYSATGTFNPGNAFRLQLAPVVADSTQIRFEDVPNPLVLGNRVSGTVPLTMAAGTYWVRVVATNPNAPIFGRVSPALLTLKPYPTATLSGGQTIHQTETAELTATFTGDAPWTLTYRDSSATNPDSARTVKTQDNPYKWTVRPTTTTAYSLSAVSNSCGVVMPPRRSVVVIVLPPLGADEPVDEMMVYPVPATTTVTVSLPNLPTGQTAWLQLFDGTGRLCWQQSTQQVRTSVPVEQQPAGTYLLRVWVNGKNMARRIMKR